MSLVLLAGVLAVAAGLALAVVALAGRPRTVVAPTAGLAAIESYYRPSLPTAPVAEPEPAFVRPTLSGPLVVARRLAGVVSPRSVIGTLQHRLDVAGNPTGWTPERLLAFKGIGLVAVAVFGGLIGTHYGAAFILFAGLGAVAGYFLPDLLIHNVGLKRQQTLQRELPDGLDMMTVCVEAGLGFDAAVSQVARKTGGPLAAELTRMLQEMQFGRSRIEALRSLQRRTTVPELSTFVTAVVQASELGIPIANVLREQAAEMRMKRRQRAEEQAQKVTVKILFPLIFCLLPALMIVVIGPGAINIMHNFSGH